MAVLDDIGGPLGALRFLVFLEWRGDSLAQNNEGNHEGDHETRDAPHRDTSRARRRVRAHAVAGVCR